MIIVQKEFPHSIMNLDIRTLAVVLAIANILQAIALVFEYLLNRTVSGLGWWALGCTSIASGFLILLLRDIVLFHVSAVIAGNSFILCGQVFIFVGVSLFISRKEKMNAVRFIFIVAALSLGYNALICLNSDISWRIVFISLTLAIISFLTAYKLYCNIDRRFNLSFNFTIISFILWGLFLCARAFLTKNYSPAKAFFDAGPLQTAAFIIPFITGSLWTYGFIFMVNQRLNIESSEDAVKIKRLLTEKDGLIGMQARQAVMGEIIEFIIHQWKQSFYALSLYAGILRKNTLPTEPNLIQNEKAIDALDTTICHMSETIDVFRNFLTPSGESLVFNPADALERVLCILNDMLYVNKIDVQKQVNATLMVMGTPAELEQVFLNIFINAKDAIVNNPDKRGIITITIEQCDTHVRIKIWNNGGGIPASILNTLFDKYTSDKNEGNGLGLYISKITIERHFKGVIRAENISEGAAFCIEIPLYSQI